MQKQLMVEKAAVERDRRWRKLLMRAEKELTAEMSEPDMRQIDPDKPLKDATYLLKDKKK